MKEDVMLKKMCMLLCLLAFAVSLSAKELPDFTVLVEKNGAAVVNISSIQNNRPAQSSPTLPNLPKGDPLFDFFNRFAPPIPREAEPSQSLGSGFIISADGYILTNAHVVNDADGVTVRLTDKREFKAKIIGVDKRTDVALVKIDATGLPKVTQGDPNSMKVGEWVLAIGSPFGFDNSVTAGIVSAKGRALPQENFVPFIQTDVAINPGNSGGPLFNMKGEVVGINSQIYSRSGGFMGLSFAIPIDVAMGVVEQLRTSGKVTRGRIGVSIQEVTNDLAESFGMSEARGALISSVEKGSAADKAGIEVSDIILKFDGKSVQASSDLPRIVANTKPSSIVVVQLWRRGDRKTVSLTVGEFNDTLAGSSKAGMAGASVARLGLVVGELSEAQKNELKVAGGLLVEEAKSTVARRVFHRGDIILALGNTDIRSLEQFNDVLKQIPQGRSAALLVRRGESVFYIALKLDEMDK